MKRKMEEMKRRTRDRRNSQAVRLLYLHTRFISQSQVLAQQYLTKVDHVHLVQSNGCRRDN